LTDPGHPNDPGNPNERNNVPDAPDPLGKRALFWAPAERHEAGPRRPGPRVLPGRQALFSAAGAVAPTDTPKKNGRPRPKLNGAPTARVAGPAGAGVGRPPTATAPRPPRPRPARAAPTPKATKVAAAEPQKTGNGPIELSCSKCGTHTDVDILKYLVLHLPWWLWRPGRGYTSLMKCPACGQRAWVSASWAARPH
jgi:hypothetical protein